MPQWIYLDSSRKNMKILSAGLMSVCLLLSGCSYSSESQPFENTTSATQNPSEEEYIEFCYNKETEERVADEECSALNNNSSTLGNYSEHYHSSSGSMTSFMLGYLLASSNTNVPAVGSSVKGYNYTSSRPTTGTIYRGTSHKGGNYQDVKSTAKSKTSQQSLKSSSNVGKKGGFGSGSKTGGGSKGS